MLSEEDGRMLSLSAVTAWHAGIEQLKSSACCFFLTDPWEKENERDEERGRSPIAVRED